MDHSVSHKSNDLKNRLRSDNCLLQLISPHYASLLQPCDVDINKQLKERLKKSTSESRRERHDALLPGQKIPSAKRKEIIDWLEI